MIELMLLVALLDHPRYQVRYRAECALRPAVAVLRPALLTLDLSTEAGKRGRRLVLEHDTALDLAADRRYSAQRFVDSLGELPWILNRQPYLDAAQQAYGCGDCTTGWLDWREATRAWLVDCVEHGLPWRDELASFWAAEIAWETNYRRRP